MTTPQPDDPNETRTQPPQEASAASLPAETGLHSSRTGGDKATLTAGADSKASETEEIPAIPGYEIKVELGSGGMGVVYRARDLTLGRDVAIKVLRSGYSGSSRLACRFDDEAKIAAQLQHPGIPPLHTLGKLPDGRPFMVMKLIKGETLSDKLKNRRRAHEDRGSYLGIFEQIAQAVAYAHSKRVIHRDLKPANIMVGSYGEVQVMDWGLAKFLDTRQAQETIEAETTLHSEIRSLRDSDEATQAGSLLGTPAFMPPEQAIGAVDQITERSDVFGLGAILCVILTGQPPFVAESSESTRVKAARGKLDEAFARLDACGAEPELIALARRCLSPEPEHRPHDAGAVAAAITALRAAAEQRARQAEMERARAEVRSAEERKRRRVKRVLVLTLFALIAVSGFAAWWLESARAERRADQLTRDAEQRGREAELLSRQLATERDVVAALNEAQVLREEGWKQASDPARWALTLLAARSSFKRAESLLGSGEPTQELRGRVEATGVGLAQDERDRDFLAELDKIEEESDIRFMIPIMIGSRFAERYARAFRNYGLDLLGMTTLEAAKRLREHRFGDRLTLAVRNWQYTRPITDQQVSTTLIFNASPSGHAAVAGEPIAQSMLRLPSVSARLNAIASAVNDEPFLRDWHAALAAKNTVELKKLLKRPEFHRLSSRELSALVDSLTSSLLAFDSSGLLLEILSIAYDRFPGDYWINFRLGTIFDQGSAALEGHSKSLRYLSAAVAARPRSALARVALGMTLLQQDKNDPQGLRLVKGAAALEPTNPWPHLMLAFQAIENQDWQELFQSSREAVRVDPEISFFMLFSLFQFNSEGIGLGSGTKKISPADLFGFYDGLVEAQPRFSGGYLLRADLRQKTGDYRSALADYRQALSFCLPDDPFRVFAKSSLTNLESMAAWEEKLPAVLEGKLQIDSPSQKVELAEYCAGFEKNNILAVRFATEAIAQNPELSRQWMNMIHFAGWAVRAAAGEGVGSGRLTEMERAELRKQALAWLRASISKADPGLRIYVADLARHNLHLAHVRDPNLLARLPIDERAEWNRFWNELPRKVETAPIPRVVKP